MSGGGFRAASFALGTLLYLDSIRFNGRKLIDHVCYISSASGGTITASLYALAKNSPDYNFHLFYRNTLRMLKGEMLLETALSNLNDKKQWKGSKNRNLINAFAKAYDQLMFKGAEFDSLFNDKLTVCFNSTEFYRGLSFRFQTHGYIGNKYINLDKFARDKTGKLKIADILAASSCFPLGFEPIVFPEDFVHPGISEQELRSIIRVTDYDGDNVRDAVIPLMDGGITDNQGLYSATLADMIARAENKRPMDLFIVTDVASYFMDNFKIPAPPKFFLWRLSVSTLISSIVLLGYLFMATSLYFLLYGTTTGEKIVGGFLFFPSLVITGWYMLDKTGDLIHWLVTGRRISFAGIRNLFNLNDGFSDNIFVKLERFFKKSRISVLIQMIKNRFSSMSTMLNDINLKQTRRLINELFYSNDLFDNRRCGNYIYNYSLQNLQSKIDRIQEKNWSNEDKARMVPSDTMTNVAESARTMGTTLWFESDEERKLMDIVNTGKFTTCGSLLEYVLDFQSGPLWKTLDETVQKNLELLKADLIVHWEEFKENPLVSNP